jgi:hypothetical protein
MSPFLHTVSGPRHPIQIGRNFTGDSSVAARIRKIKTSGFEKGTQKRFRCVRAVTQQEREGSNFEKRDLSWSAAGMRPLPASLSADHGVRFPLIIPAGTTRVDIAAPDRLICVLARKSTVQDLGPGSPWLLQRVPADLLDRLLSWSSAHGSC